MENTIKDAEDLLECSKTKDYDVYPNFRKPVSYTHLTLPTNREV